MHIGTLRSQQQRYVLRGIRFRELEVLIFPNAYSYQITWRFYSFAHLFPPKLLKIEQPNFIQQGNNKIGLLAWNAYIAFIDLARSMHERSTGVTELPNAASWSGGNVHSFSHHLAGGANVAPSGGVLFKAITTITSYILLGRFPLLIQQTIRNILNLYEIYLISILTIAQLAIILTILLPTKLVCSRTGIW